MARYPGRMKRLFLSALMAVLLVPASAQALTPQQIFGIQDQLSVSMFGDARFQALKVGASRMNVDWRIASTPSPARNRLDAWYAAVQASHLKALLSLEGFQQTHIPTNAEYRQAFLALRSRYPAITEFSAWNEANHPTQPLRGHPKDAARLAKLSVDLCPGCQIVGLTLVMSPTFQRDIQYAAAFQSALSPRYRRKLIWGLHVYADQNRNTDVRLHAFIRSFPRGKIWLTESAAWAQFAPPTWQFNLKRQAKATATVFRTAVRYRKRVARLYWFQWQGTAETDHAVRWDSGLISAGGSSRPAYRVALAERFKTR